MQKRLNVLAVLAGAAILGISAAPAAAVVYTLEYTFTPNGTMNGNPFELAHAPTDPFGGTITFDSADYVMTEILRRFVAAADYRFATDGGLPWSMDVPEKNGQDLELPPEDGQWSVTNGLLIFKDLGTGARINVGTTGGAVFDDLRVNEYFQTSVSQAASAGRVDYTFTPDGTMNGSPFGLGSPPTDGFEAALTYDPADAQTTYGANSVPYGLFAFESVNGNPWDLGSVLETNGQDLRFGDTPGDYTPVEALIFYDTTTQVRINLDPGGSAYFFDQTRNNAYFGANWQLEITPEPATLALAAVGAAGVLLRRRRG